MKRKLFYLPLNTDFNREYFDDLLSFVSAEKAMRISEFRNNTDKKLSLYAHVLVKLIAEKEYGLRTDRITVAENDSGKPYIMESPDIHFNISHTYNAVAVGFSSNPVGVDIEKTGKANLSVVKRFFSEQEKEYISSHAEHIDTAFFEIWTKKESYIKCLGSGLKKPLNSFCVFDDNLKGNFTTFKKDDYIISFYDGANGKCSDIINICETDIEKKKLYY